MFAVLSARPSSRRLLLSRIFCLWMPAHRRRMFDLGVDFSADQKREAGDVQPHQQDHRCAQRSVGLAVTIKKVQISAKSERRRDPEQDANQRTGGNPVPVLLFEVGTVVVDQRE